MVGIERGWQKGPDTSLMGAGSYSDKLPSQSLFAIQLSASPQKKSGFVINNVFLAC